MELILFTDLIDALGKVAGGLKVIVNLPKVERGDDAQTLAKTHRLANTRSNTEIMWLPRNYI